MEGTSNWEYYFPILNDRNKERLDYLINKKVEDELKNTNIISASFRENALSPLRGFINSVSEELLSYLFLFQVSVSQEIHILKVTEITVVLSTEDPKFRPKNSINYYPEYIAFDLFFTLRNDSSYLHFRSVDPDYSIESIYSGKLSDFDVSSLSSYLGTMNN